MVENLIKNFGWAHFILTSSAKFKTKAGSLVDLH